MSDYEKALVHLTRIARNGQTRFGGPRYKFITAEGTPYYSADDTTGSFWLDKGDLPVDEDFDPTEVWLDLYHGNVTGYWIVYDA